MLSLALTSALIDGNPVVAQVLAAAGDAGEPGEVPDLFMFSALVGVLMPPLVAVINQPRWSSMARNVVVLASSIGIGAGTAALEGRLTTDRWITAALIVGTAAVAAYRTFWKTAATRIEYATSGDSLPASRR